MDQLKFERIITDQMSRSEVLLAGKGHEYAEGADTSQRIDRLAHFKKAAALQGVTTAQAAFGMLTKHLVSVADMVASGGEYPLEKWDEKISDSINYLLILRAIVEEERPA
nr:MAG TPA: hypothetical protein [Bacteriophage sp.]